MLDKNQLESKAYKFIENIQVNKKQLLQILNIYEEKGREFYYNKLFERDEEAFKEINRYTDNFYIAKILKIDFTDSKLQKWSKRKYKPKNKQEQFYNNLKLTIQNVHVHHVNFSLVYSEVNALSKLIYKDIAKPSLRKVELKENDLKFGSNKRKVVDELVNLCNDYDKLLRNNEHEKLLVIISFYIDFINLKLFNENNDIIGLILLYTLIQKYFTCFKYVSFFKHLYFRINEFSEAVNQASFQWDSGIPRLSFLYETIILILYESYLELKDKSKEYDFDRKINKGDNVEGTIRKGPEIFTKAYLRKKHPNISDSTIERTLQRLKEERKIQPLGTGRGAKWQKLVNENTDVKQLVLFTETDFD